MHIIFESSITSDIKDKYILLPLDTFFYKSAGIKETAFCLMEISPLEMFTIEEDIKAHHDLIECYKSKNFSECVELINQLNGKWNSELNSFYNTLLQRIKLLDGKDLTNWNYIISCP